jgi:hypothetical protein
MVDMTLKSISWSKQNVFSTAMLLISVLAMYNWFISPNTQYLSAAQKYRQIADKTEQQSRILYSNLGARRKETYNLSQQFETKKQNFFDVNEAKSFLSGIQSEAEKSGCLVSNLKLSPPKDMSTKDNNSLEIYRYQIDMNLMGNYLNIVKFLNTLQNRPAKIWVETMNIGLKNAAKDYLDCDLTISIYTLKIKENISNVKNKQIPNVNDRDNPNKSVNNKSGHRRAGN